MLPLESNNESRKESGIPLHPDYSMTPIAFSEVDYVEYLGFEKARLSLQISEGEPDSYTQNNTEELKSGQKTQTNTSSNLNTVNFNNSTNKPITTPPIDRKKYFRRSILHSCNTIESKFSTNKNHPNVNINLSRKNSCTINQDDNNDIIIKPKILDPCQRIIVLGGRQFDIIKQSQYL